MWSWVSGVQAVGGMLLPDPCTQQLRLAILLETTTSRDFENQKQQNNWMRPLRSWMWGCQKAALSGISRFWVLQGRLRFWLTAAKALPKDAATPKPQSGKAPEMPSSAKPAAAGCMPIGCTGADAELEHKYHCGGSKVMISQPI